MYADSGLCRGDILRSESFQGLGKIGINGTMSTKNSSVVSDDAESIATKHCSMLFRHLVVNDNIISHPIIFRSTTQTVHEYGFVSNIPRVQPKVSSDGAMRGGEFRNQSIGLPE
eukprot:CAMPEP_0172484076 /NCGR_PEP_ID=MMETSP1066-20121228/11350_1 /TAXON_ID=671091 /ORGANISM="Coscinodiscus wailesii, Strain CCMP2513" /LENGTH=113 /DNA_ID=CAMNT_0013248339 /DNA_START=513 /DNA_END=854 /DNA_ORIENTATION=+